MKKYYKANLYKFADYQKVKTLFDGVVLDYDYKDESNCENTNYMDSYLPIMEIIFEKTANPYYVKERSTGILIPMLTIIDSETALSLEEKRLRMYSIKTFLNRAVPIFIINKKVVHRNNTGLEMDSFYPEQVLDEEILKEYDRMHQDKRKFLHILMEILSESLKDMKDDISKSKDAMPVIYCGL